MKGNDLQINSILHDGNQLTDKPLIVKQLSLYSNNPYVTYSKSPSLKL